MNNQICFTTSRRQFSSDLFTLMFLLFFKNLLFDDLFLLFVFGNVA